jgi:hypothetical protein
LPNQNPVATDVTANVHLGVAFTFNVPASDPESGTLTLVSTTNSSPELLVTLNGGLSLTVQTQAGAAEGNIFNFSYTVADNGSPVGTDAATMTIRVDPVTASTSTSTSTTTTTSSTTTTTTIPCTGSITNVDKSPVSNGGSHDVALLKKDVVLTFSWSGSCPNLAFEYEPNLIDGIPNARLETITSTTFTIQGEPSGYLWSDGDHTLTFLNGTTVLDTDLLEVSP